MGCAAARSGSTASTAHPSRRRSAASSSLASDAIARPTRSTSIPTSRPSGRHSSEDRVDPDQSPPTQLPAALSRQLGQARRMSDRPNLLILMADQLTAAALRAYGGRTARTPHIDALADQGVV